MTERVDFASLSLPQQHFPPEATPAKPSVIFREKSTAWGEQIQHNLVLSCSFSKELLQVIILATQKGAGVIQHCSVTVKEGSVVAGQLDHFEELPASCTCSLAARYPAASPCFSWRHNCSRGRVIFWKAVGKSDRPGIWCFQLRHSLVFSTDPPLSDISVMLEMVCGKQQLNSTTWCQESRGEHNYLKETGRETRSEKEAAWGWSQY